VHVEGKVTLWKIRMQTTTKDEVRGLSVCRDRPVRAAHGKPGEVRPAIQYVA
jgi:hypothetical protein